MEPSWGSYYQKDWVKVNAWIYTKSHYQIQTSSLIFTGGLCFSENISYVCSWNCCPFPFLKTLNYYTFPSFFYYFYLQIEPSLQSLYLCVCMYDTLGKTVETNQYYTITHNITLLTALFFFTFFHREAILLLLLLLSCFSRVQLWATPETAAHQGPPTLGFSRQEHWSGLLFPSPMHKSEKWKWSCSVMSDS